MRPRNLLSLSLALALGAFAAPALAQSAGGVRPNLVVVEGLAGAWQSHEKTGDDDPSNGLSIGSSTTTSLTNQTLRLGYHRVLGPLTLGGGLHYGTYSSVSHLLLAPRVGGLFGSSGFAIWPRAGLTYARTKLDFGGLGATTTETMAAAELLFLAELAPHVGVLFGPGIELGLSGKQKTESTKSSASEDYKSRVIGVQLGLFADF